MGMLYVVGLGPGKASGRTAEAQAALEAADVLCGYTGYLELLGTEFPDKETFSTPMTGELDRCRKALELAKSGKTVALVCSGDAGVYGMASPLLECAEEYPDVDIEMVSGVTAATSGAALLGAPLGHDFCIISLSDLLTPWEIIENRLQAAASADFCIALYNPSSRRRQDYLERACAILLRSGKSPDTVCGWARNIGRDGQTCGTCTLAELVSFSADMFTTIYIGSSTTRLINGRMVTPRGYRK